MYFVKGVKAARRIDVKSYLADSLIFMLWEISISRSINSSGRMCKPQRGSALLKLPASETKADRKAGAFQRKRSVKWALRKC